MLVGLLFLPFVFWEDGVHFRVTQVEQRPGKRRGQGRNLSVLFGSAAVKPHTFSAQSPEEQTRDNELNLSTAKEVREGSQ